MLKVENEIILIEKEIIPKIIDEIYKIDHVNDGIGIVKFIDGFSHEKYYQRISISYQPDLCFILGYSKDIINEIKEEIKKIVKSKLNDRIAANLKRKRKRIKTIIINNYIPKILIINK